MWNIAQGENTVGLVMGYRIGHFCVDLIKWDFYLLGFLFNLFYVILFVFRHICINYKIIIFI